MTINSLPLPAPGTQRDMTEVTYRTHLDAQLKQEFLENVSFSSSMLPNKRRFLEEEENKRQKKKRRNRIRHKNRTHFWQTHSKGERQANGIVSERGPMNIHTGGCKILRGLYNKWRNERQFEASSQ